MALNINNVQTENITELLLKALQSSEVDWRCVEWDLEWAAGRPVWKHDACHAIEIHKNELDMMKCAIFAAYDIESYQPMKLQNLIFFVSHVLAILLKVKSERLLLKQTLLLWLCEIRVSTKL